MNEQNIFKNDNVTSNSAQLEILKKNFPNCFDKDGHFILDSFKEVIKENDLDFSEESYSLNWLGKSYAQLLRNEKAHTFIQPNHDHNNQEINKNSQNLLIKGDNLEVLKHLRNAYSEKIKMIYIDPPYNTGSDGFVYQDDRKFTQSELMHLAKVSEDEAKRILDFTSKGSNSHSAWLTFIYPRLYIARELLREDGVIFISIDDNEQAQLKLLCDEVFGEENYLGSICWKNVTDNNPTNIAIEHEYVFVYAKSKNLVAPIWKSFISDIKDLLIDIGIDFNQKYSNQETLQKEYTKWFRENRFQLGELDRYKYIDQKGVYTGSQSVHNPGRDGYRYDVMHPETNKPCKQPLMGYRFPETTMSELLNEGKILFGKDHDKIIELKVYAKEFKDKLSSMLVLDGRVGATELRGLFPEVKTIFTNPKPVELLKKLTSFCTDTSGVILDFFAGSGTTAHAVMDLNAEDNGNRQFILVQLPEETDKKSEAYKAGYKIIFEITKARIEKAGEKIQQEHPEYEGDLGFKVFETMPLPDHYNNEVLELNAESQLEMFDGAKNDEQLLNAILTTWTLYDRIPLTSSLETLLIDDYNAQYSSEYNTLYLMQPNLTTQNIKTLINKIEIDPQFVPEKIVIYGFNFDSKIQRELDEALKSYQNKKSLNIDLLVRYY